MQLISTHERLRGGGEIRPFMVQGINRARMVLAIVSQEALNRRDWVREEVTLAGGRLNEQ